MIVVVVVGGAVCQSTTYPSTTETTILWLHKFTSGRDPPKLTVSQYPPADLCSMNSVWGGIQLA